nr:MAG TPA: hypothetical protein [Caudoviricetes sp.]
MSFQRPLLPTVGLFNIVLIRFAPSYNVSCLRDSVNHSFRFLIKV